MVDARPLLCVPITAPGGDAALDQLERALSWPEVTAVELRVDLVGEGESHPWVAAAIARCREERVHCLVTARLCGAAPYIAAIRAGADAVDVDVDEGADVIAAVRRAIEDRAVVRGRRCSLTVSHHDYLGTPPLTELIGEFERCRAAGADAVKIVTTAHSVADNFEIIGLIGYGRGLGIATTAFAMGEHGVASRVLAHALGSAVSYVALEDGQGSAPGQLTLEHAILTLPTPARSTGPRESTPSKTTPIPHTDIYGILGNPVSHSLSPAMHNRAYGAIGARAIYAPFLVTDLAEAIGAIRAHGVRGVSVTVPYKIEVMRYLDDVDAVARRVGAVNTVVNRGGKLRGYNTDCVGVVRSLEKAMGPAPILGRPGARKPSSPLAGKRAVIIGAGGTARAACFGLIDAGVAVTIVNRTANKARQLAAEAGCAWASLEALRSGELAGDILVNTTTVGMAPRATEMPVPAEVLPNFSVVLDAVYSPVRTRLLTEAAAAGLNAVSGLDVLVAQGAAQFELWLGQPAPVGVMRQGVDAGAVLDGPPTVGTLPGSKSLTQRALVCAALGAGTSHLTGALIAEDTEHLMGALRALGVRIDVAGTSVTVVGVGGRFAPASHTIELGNNGTATRLLIALCALGSGTYTLDGSERLRERPVGPVVDAIRVLGAQVEYLGQEGYLPVRVSAPGQLAGGEVAFGDLDSSQYVSAIMLVAPYAAAQVTIRMAGKVVSEPYLDLTRNVMSAFGVSTYSEVERVLVVGAGTYEAREYAVEADASSATYPAAAALIGGRRVRLAGIGPNSVQGDAAFLRLLRNLGAEVRTEGGTTTVSGVALTPGDMTFDMGAIPDTVPTLAVLAAFRDGVTTITGVAHLRVKESDRIAALVAELTRLGCEARELPDGLTVVGRGGRGLKGAVVRTYDDHRIAMAFALASLRVAGLTVEDPSCVAKSFPTYWDDMRPLGVGIAPLLILIGYRATGKSTVGRSLAAMLGTSFTDLDEVVASEAGASVAEIVADGGWERFRTLEAKALSEVLQTSRGIVATGGGVVTDGRSTTLLRWAKSAGSAVVWLTASVDRIVEWIGADPNSQANRPSLTGVSDLRAETERVLEQRTPAYAALADLRVVTDNESAEESAHEVAVWLAADRRSAKSSRAHSASSTEVSNVRQ